MSKDVDVTVSWHPFQLNPAATRENKLALYNRKFSPERVKSMIPMMQVNMHACAHETANVHPENHRTALPSWG